MDQNLRIAVVGAGLIGRPHAQRVKDHPQMELAYVVDPFLQPADAAFGPGTIVTADLGKALSEVDGAIFATPNALHCEGALAAITAGVPVLVEKPIANTLRAAEQMVAVAEAADLPLLIGHHRRHSPLLDAAAQAVASGAIGDPVAVMGSALFYKPDDYFDAAPWRRQAGGGPILINLIHDVDALRALCGEIVRVQAASSDATRRFAVEDTATIILTFANGALGTFLVSDTATLPIQRQDPLDLQREHFADVVRREAEPKVTARDGLQSLRVVQAVIEAARTGQPIEVPPVDPTPS